MVKQFIFVAAIVGLSSCSTADIFISGGGRVSWPPEQRQRIPERLPDRHRVPERKPVYRVPVANKSFIPPGHLPPPGACKIWTPGKPPGHQPPPENCENAFYYVQPGQMVVRRDPYDKHLIEVSKAYLYRHQLHFEVEYYRAN